MLSADLLSGKSIIVTGASGLLGNQFIHAIAKHGGIPILVDLDVNRLKDQALTIQGEYGIKPFYYSADVTTEIQLQDVLNDLRRNNVILSGLVNNAARNPKMQTHAINETNRIESFSIETWHNDLDVSLLGSFLCSKIFGTWMAENTGGIILNISSDLGLIAPDQRLYRLAGRKPEDQPVKPVTYSVAKAGIIGLTRYLATYWPGIIRSNCLCPGGVENGQDQEFMTKLTSLIPLNRMAKLDEYNDLLVFMLSPSSSYLNGAVISADGGRTCW